MHAPNPVVTLSCTLMCGCRMVTNIQTRMRQVIQAFVLPTTRYSDTEKNKLLL